MFTSKLTAAIVKLKDMLIATIQKTRLLMYYLKFQPYLILLLIAITFYGLAFSHFTVLKHNVFQSSGWDLGVFDQALYTTLYHGKFLYYTADLYLNPTGCYFTQHVSPILLILLPFYAINPAATTLLIIKSFILGLGALPLYFLAQELLESKKAAFLFAIIYLLYAPLHGANWFDFQPQIFLPLLFFSMFYFAVKSKWLPYFIVTALAAMVEEHISLLIFLSAGYLLLTSKVRPFWQSLKTFHSINRNSASVIAMLFSAIYFLAAGWIKSLFPVNTQLTHIYKAYHVFSVLGFKSDSLYLPLYVLFNPQRAFNALLFDFPLKFLYIILLFAPLLFFSFRSKLVLVTLPFLGMFLLSNFNAYYSVGSHYPLYIIAFIFIAALMVLKRYQHNARTSILKTMLITSILLTASITPISPLAAPFINQRLLWYPPTNLEPNEQITSLTNLLNAVPPDASILTQNTIFPHVSNRLNAYVLPISSILNDTEYIRSLINRSDFILLDLTWNDWNTNFVLNEITKNNTYGAFALARNAILFKRDFQGEPLFANYTNYRVFSAYKDLALSQYAQAVNDNTVIDQKVVMSPNGYIGHFVYGPSIYLLPGAYEVTFTAKTDAVGGGRILGFDVVSNLTYPPLSKRDVFDFELPPFTWTNFTLSFTSTRILFNVEFRAFSYGVKNLYIDKVVLKRVSSDATSDFGTQTFGSDDLQLAAGYKSKDGLIVFAQNTSSGTIWFGPYINLPTGKYRCTAWLRISPLSQNAFERVLTLSVSSDCGSHVYARCDVSPSNFFVNGQPQNWQKFTLEFIAKEPLSAIEVAGHALSSNFTISLAYVLLEKIGVTAESNNVVFDIQSGLQVDAGQIIKDTSSRSGIVALSQKGLNEGIMVYGPYVSFFQGNYTAIFQIKTTEAMQNASIRFEIAYQPNSKILATKELNSTCIISDSWFNVTLPFSIQLLTDNVEFRVYSNGMMNLYVDTVTVLFP